jgi:hypothetical protein
MVICLLITAYFEYVEELLLPAVECAWGLIVSGQAKIQSTELLVPDLFFKVQIVIGKVEKV